MYVSRPYVKDELLLFAVRLQYTGKCEWRTFAVTRWVYSECEWKLQRVNIMYYVRCEGRSRVRNMNMTEAKLQLWHRFDTIPLSIVTCDAGIHNLHKHNHLSYTRIHDRYSSHLEVGSECSVSIVLYYYFNLHLNYKLLYKPIGSASIFVRVLAKSAFFVSVPSYSQFCYFILYYTRILWTSKSSTLVLI